ncbi:MAG TPA: hypothetical protein VM554_12715 [Acidisarcina sp.]|nr:hypothetical protein [Acidisarcina sp.]
MSSTEADRRSQRREWLPVLVAATALALVAFDYCFEHHLLLLYGDAVAHLHIARRVFDSMNPGFRQLGSVWLPLPHLLLIPFVQRMDWWQNGAAGAFPSMACYIAGCVGIYRLARLWLAPRVSLLALAFFALNPGLLYLQSTAMTEPLFLAEMIWVALLVAEFCLELDSGEAGRRADRLLIAAGLVLVAAVYTRYDGWIYASFAWLVVAIALWRQHKLREPVMGSFILFTVMLGAAPALWLAYNARQFGDPLDFMRGPYSARAIELRTATPGSPHYPGWHSMRVAALHFLKAAELDAVPIRWANKLLWLSVAGTGLALYARSRAIGAALLLWIPLPFYAYSIAYGSVPIFIPVWWPFSWYNTRYGMEMLPVFALFAAFAASWLLSWVQARSPKAGQWVYATMILLILANSAALLHARPIVLQEAIANSRTRIPFEGALADALRSLPPDGLILMYTSEHVGALQQAAIPLRRTINETDYYRFKPALEKPAESARWVVATDGDVVDKAIKLHPDHLELMSVTCSTGQPCARVYRSQVDTPVAPAAPGQ